MSKAETILEAPIVESFFGLFGLEDEGLSADDVLIGLLDHGLFAEKVPPCFTSKGLSVIAEALLDNLFDEEEEKKLKKNIAQMF